MAGDCGSTCPVEGGFYKYDPSVGGNAALLSAFGILSPAVAFLGFRFHTPVFSLTLVAGLLLAVVGFVGRVLLNSSPQSQVFFVLSLLGTFLGPVCIIGAVFLTLPHILSVYGDHVSPIHPAWAGAVFYGLQVVAAIIQLVGVVFVAHDLKAMGREGGSRLAAGGLGVQLLALLGFTGLHFWFTLGLSARKSGLDPKHSAIYRSPKFKRFLFGAELAAVLLLAYSVYRIVEMAGGVMGSLFQNEIAFMIMNGVVPLTAAVLLTVLHPGAAFGSAWGATSPLRVQKRKTIPPPLKPRRGATEQMAHARYEPNIRSQISPTSQKSAARSSNPPEIPGGSPGLPAHPKATLKTSPMPSPTGTAGTAESRKSMRAERRSNVAPQRMVQDDVLW